MGSFLKSVWQKLFGGPGQGAGGDNPNRREMLSNSGASKGTFPSTLEGFGYRFNTKGELVDKSGGKFQFMVKKDDPEYNQRRYVVLGEVVTDHLYGIMENELKLERVPVPVDARVDEPQSFIFRTKDSADNQNMMVLIHGSGAVRAGQWTRKLIINENIDTGSQLPYIRRAIDGGFGVIVMNTNLNEAVVDGKVRKIRGSETPENHGVYVWQHFVQPAKAQNVAVVAHSYGGIVACTIAETFLKDFQRRVFSIVFTDSVHTDGRALWSKPVKDFMKQRAVNYISAVEPLDTRMENIHSDDCLALSAGTTEHERTSHSCINSAFQFMNRRHGAWLNKTIFSRFKSEL
ncbi:cotranscriptional regulator ARB2A-like [Babylonia areolata]|uniref:cotranscriptional regulator ARB2A-like n=1 Tax=Babylonia areolata TaxID=304850 RepID=UPI003FD2E0F7